MARKIVSSLFAFVMVAVVMLTSGSCVYAQVAGSTMTGTLTDASGAVIPNAQVAINNTATGEVRAVTTNTSGLYTAPNLLPGSYEVTVTARGFSTEIRSGITLTVGAQQVLNITMQVGQATQTIRVTGEAPAVELANSTIGGVIGETTVVELPLNGRDWTQLATLQPGISSVASIQPAITNPQERGSRGFGAQLAISGARPQENSYRIDGVNVNDSTNGGPGSVSGSALGVDAIQEFSVLTSNYSAEYGRTAGGVVNAITKSGTNQFHGDGYEFLRNSALDARNYFDPATIPEFRRNQFGGSLGGPIRKDRVFFFADYEGLRQNLGVTTVDTVPSLDARNGIIHNPDGTTTTVTVNALAAPFLTFFAPPNGPILAPGNTGIFAFSGAQVTSENFVTARIDYRLSDKDSLFGSYQYDKGNLSLPDSLNTQLLTPNAGRQFLALEETHIFTPQLLNSFRVGYNRSTSVNVGIPAAINPADASLSFSAVPGQYAPVVSIPGVTEFTGGLHSNSDSTFLLNAFQVYDDVFLTKGIHSMKFGFAVERDQQRIFQASLTGGSFKFGSLTDFLTNIPKSFSAAPPGEVSPRDWRQSIVGGYFQDDIHWRPSLTVNLGVRYEMSTVPTEILGKDESLRNITDPSPHLGNPLFSNPTLRNFAPRIGFAWDPFGNGKTSVRGGFGIFDVLPLIYEFKEMEAAGAPFYLSETASNLPPGSFPTGAFDLIAAAALLRSTHIEANPHPNYVMQWNVNVQRQLTPSLAATVAYLGSRSVHQPFHMDDANIVLPTLTSAGYLWPFPAGNGTVLNPNRGRIDYVDWGNNAFYDALEVEISKRMSHGFQVQGSYTWSKSIDEGSASVISDPYANSITSLLFFDRTLRRAVSDFNVGQNLVVNYIWNIPTPGSFHGPTAWLAHGWQLGSIFTVQSGLPFTPLIGGDPLGENSSDPFAYPDRLTGPGCKSQVNPGNVNNYIKLQCFAVPMATPAIAAECTPFQPGGPPNPIAVGTCSNLLGTSTRNDLNGPGLMDLDFSLFKNNQIKENLNLQFRAEFFNVLNHSNFLAPIANSTLFDQTGAPVGGAGSINQTSTSAREIQFALKLVW